MKWIISLILTVVLIGVSISSHAQPGRYGPPGPGPGAILALPAFIMGMFIGGALSASPQPPQVYYYPPAPAYPTVPCPSGYMFVPPYPPYGGRCVSR